MILHKTPAQEISPGIFLLNLSLIPGTSAIASRVPSGTSGIYAWYQNFSDVTTKTDSKVYFDSLIDHIHAPKFSPRSTRLPPSHRIKLSSDQKLSDKKKQSLEALCQNDGFRHLLSQSLDLSIFFQRPLYIGKSSDLRSRVITHLRSDSDLRQRLSEAGIKIDTCFLMYICLSDGFEEDIEGEALIPSEDVMEDVLSRLFQPAFTVRYG